MGKKTGRPRGRPAGAKSSRTKEREQAVAEASARIGEAIPGAFQGDAHAFLMAVYKDPSVPLKMRIDAANSAAPYEKPKLQAVTLEGNKDAPLVHEHRNLDADAFAGRIAGLSARRTAGEGAGSSEH